MGSSIDSNSDIRCIQQRWEINNHYDCSVGCHIFHRHCHFGSENILAMDCQPAFVLERFTTLELNVTGWRFQMSCLLPQVLHVCFENLINTHAVCQHSTAAHVILIDTHILLGFFFFFKGFLVVQPDPEGWQIMDDLGRQCALTFVASCPAICAKVEFFNFFFFWHMLVLDLQVALCLVFIIDGGNNGWSCLICGEFKLESKTAPAWIF